MRKCRIGLLTVAAVLATATAASAHPGFRPDEVPAGQAEVELVMEHSCGVDGEDPVPGGPSSPTTLVAVSWPDGFRLDPRRLDGFTVEVDEDEGVSSWEATDGGVDGELVLPAVVTVEGTVGEDLLVPVYQECANGEFVRWAAEPGENGDPIVTLGIAEGEPGPLPTPARTASPSLSLGPTPGPTTTPTASPTPSPNPSPDPSPTPSASPSPASTATPTASPSVAAATDVDTGGGNGWWLVAAVVVIVAIGGTLLARRRGDEASA